MVKTVIELSVLKFAEDTLMIDKVETNKVNNKLKQ